LPASLIKRVLVVPARLGLADRHGVGARERLFQRFVELAIDRPPFVFGLVVVRLGYILNVPFGTGARR
jgi:hypothetical protein